MTVPKPERPGARIEYWTALIAALDLFGRRWTLRIVGELQHDPASFRALQHRCDNASPQQTIAARSVPARRDRLRSLGQDPVVILRLLIWASPTP